MAKHNSDHEQVACAQRHKEGVVSLSDRDRNFFLSALARPARPMPEAIRKAKAHQGALVASD